MAILVYNKNNEDYSMCPNNYYIGRGSILGNPYTHLPLKGTMAIYHTRNREEAIERYGGYFDLMYERDSEFKAVVDEIYEKYKRGEDIYFGCYCNSEEECHGGVIKKKLQSRRLKEIIQEYKNKNETIYNKIIDKTK